MKNYDNRFLVKPLNAALKLIEKYISYFKEAFMHGGAYSYGSAIDTLYSGQYMVEEHPDIVVVNLEIIFLPALYRTIRRCTV